MPENVPGIQTSTEWQMFKSEDKIILVGEHVKASLLDMSTL